MSKHSSLHPSHGHVMGTGDHHPHTYTVTGTGPHHSSHVTEHYSPTTTTVATLTDASGVQTFSVAVGARDEGHPSGPWMHPTGSESWGPHGSAVKSWLSEHSGHWTATGTGKESHGSTASNQGPPDSTSTIHTTSTEFVSVKPSGTGHLPRDEDQISKSTSTGMASSGNHTSHSARPTLSSLKSHTTNNPIVGPGPVSHTKSHTTRNPIGGPGPVSHTKSHTTRNPIGGPGPVSHTKSHTTEHHSTGPGSVGTSMAVREKSSVTFHVGPGHLTSRPTRTTLMTSTCTESSGMSLII